MGKKTDKLWSYFSKHREERANMHAICQIKVPANTGAICASKLGTPSYTTSSMRAHLETFHKPEVNILVIFVQNFLTYMHLL
jgi:hypothetical protein